MENKENEKEQDQLEEKKGEFQNGEIVESFVYTNANDGTGFVSNADNSSAQQPKTEENDVTSSSNNEEEKKENEPNLNELNSETTNIGNDRQEQNDIGEELVKKDQLSLSQSNKAEIEEIKTFVQKEKKKNKRKFVFISILCALLLIGCAVLVYFLFFKDNGSQPQVPSDGKYNISINNFEGGEIGLASNRVEPNKEVVLTFEQKMFYELENLYYIKEDSTEKIQIFDNKFVMPSANITIFAECKSVPFATYQNDLVDYSYVIDQNTVTISLKPNQNALLLDIINYETNKMAFLNELEYFSFMTYLLPILLPTAESPAEGISEEDINNLLNNFYFDPILPEKIESFYKNYFNNFDLEGYLETVYLTDDQKEIFKSKVNAMKNGVIEITLPYSEGQHYLINMQDKNKIETITQDGYTIQAYKDQGEAVIYKCDSVETAVVVPEEIAGYKIVGIKNPYSTGGGDNLVFAQTVTSLLLPQTLKSISFGMLQNLKLKYLEVPEGIDLIQEMSIDGNESNALVIKFNSSKAPNFVSLTGESKSSGEIILVVPKGAKANYTQLQETFFKKDKTSLIEAEQFYKNEEALYLLENEDKTSTIVGFLDDSLSEINIPQTVEANGILYNITKLNDNLFKENRTITKVTLPEGLEEIGENAFYYTTALENINIPNSLKIIKSQAFKNSNIQALSFGENITMIGNNAFDSCLNLVTVEFNVNAPITDIQENTFRNCDSLETISLPTALVQIKDEAFYQCYNLQEIVLPENLQQIGTGAFYSCTNLSTIQINSTKLNFIGPKVFWGTNIKSLKFSIAQNSTLNIATEAFASMYHLQEVTFEGEGKLSLSSGIFNSDNHLTTIVYKLQETPQVEAGTSLGILWPTTIFVEDSSYENFAKDSSFATLFNGTVKKLSEKV